MNQKVYINVPLESGLATILCANDAERIFLVSGKASYEKSGAAVRCASIFSDKIVTHFSGFSPNPTMTEVVSATALFKSVPHDLILAIGGGSAIDIAKAVNALATNAKHEYEAYITGQKKIEQVACPLVAVPTTAGSGSEATHFAVVYIGSKKYSLAHPAMLPSYTILDPSLTNSLPKTIAAASGLDALSQAIESYWSVNATAESRSYSKAALKFIVPNLIPAVLEHDQVARASLSEGAYYSGKAINIAKTSAAHALSYAITSHFGVAHGHAVALLLPEIFRYNAAVTEADVADSRGAAYVSAGLRDLCELLGVVDVVQAAEKLRDLIEVLGLPTRLSELGVTAADIPLLLEGISAERMGNNPRLLGKEAAERILMSIM